MTRPQPSQATRPPLADPELAGIRDAMDKTTNGGRDESSARQRADAYVAAHPEMFTGMETMTYQEVCAAVSTFRSAGDASAQWKAEAWLLHKFDKQHVGGAFQAKLRTPGS